MDLQEEYFRRKTVPAHLIKYPERANLILRAKETWEGRNGVKPEWNWLHVSIDLRQEPNHPAQFQFVVAANPVIYASADFSHFSYQNTKIITDSRFEWDQYENSVLQWAKQHATQYVAVPSSEAIFVSWEMFLANYDSWIANFLPYRVIDWLSESLHNEDVDSRLEAIRSVEEWIREKYERVHACWRNIRQQLDQKNYADWFAEVINDLGKHSKELKS
jgi:hypothetical protein